MPTVSDLEPLPGNLQFLGEHKVLVMQKSAFRWDLQQRIHHPLSMI